MMCACHRLGDFASTFGTPLTEDQDEHASHNSYRIGCSRYSQALYQFLQILLQQDHTRMNGHACVMNHHKILLYLMHPYAHALT